MVNFIAILVYILFAYLIYRAVLKGRNDIKLTRKSYVRAFLGGALPCTACIAVFELLFDRFVPITQETLGGEIFTAFFRAALIEEGFKLIFSNTAIKKNQPVSKLEFMLLCGMIGAGYGFTEKLFYGGGVILMVNALLPLHIFFQFLMGALLYEKSGAKAYLLPFLCHGMWDSLLAVAGWMMNREAFALQTIGVLMFIALAVGGIIAEIKIIRKMRAMPQLETPETE